MKYCSYDSYYGEYQKQNAAVLTATGRIAAATQRISLAYAGYYSFT